MRKVNRKYKKNVSELISEMKQMLREPKLTMENMIFSETDEPNMEDNFDNDDIMNDYREEDDKFKNSTSSIKNSINQIRQIALKAIAQLADNPTSAEYDLMKKIWNLCDKSFEVTADKSNKPKSNEYERE